MEIPQDFRSIIDAWPSAREFARDVAGVGKQELGRVWRRRNRVPAAHHPAVQRLFKKRSGMFVSLEYMAELNARGRGQGY